MGRFRVLSMLVFSSVPRSAISDGSTLTVVWHFRTTRERLLEVCCMIDCALPARCTSCPEFWDINAAQMARHGTF
ncbi:hypothetical protein EDD16DRAFT_1666043, partial [Pisolithus croceorrhizus]